MRDVIVHPAWCSFQLSNDFVMMMRTDLFGYCDREEVRAVVEFPLHASPGLTTSADVEKAKAISMTVHTEARSLYYAKPAGTA